MSEHIIAEADTGIRLDRWFRRHVPGLPHSMLEKALRKGDIRVGGKKARASDRLETGQALDIRFDTKDFREVAKKQPSLAHEMTPQDIQAMQQMVLFKSKDAIVINKPPGLAVQGGTGILRSVDGMLDALRFDARERPKLVHRLDRDTSGVLVLGRSAAATARLARVFADKTAEKIYWALVKGVPEIAEGKIDLPLAKQEEGDHEKVAIDKENGKRAVTHYRVLDRLGSVLAWVELMPVTGRMHQLRVHMAAIGHPIVADGKYGGKEAFIDGMEITRKLHLHARRVIIEGMLDVTAPLPGHMKESWKKLGLEE